MTVLAKPPSAASAELFARLRAEQLDKEGDKGVSPLPPRRSLEDLHGRLL
jgi:hypothetical protein